MTDFSRRTMLASAAGTAALGLTGNLAFLPAAHAKELREKGHYRYRIGDIEVTSIYDGVWQNKGFDQIAVGTSGDDVKSALRKAGKTTEFIPIEFAFTVIRTGGRTILIDAGTGGQLAPTAGLAARGGLAAAGVTPETVDAIFVSHMHPDHIFGLMEKDTNEQVFPDFWTDPSIIGKLPERRKPLAQRIQATFPRWGNITVLSGELEFAPGLRNVNSYGHSAGHSSVHVSSGSDEVMLISDALIVPALFLANLDWQLAFDADRDQATATRKGIVERAIADDMMIAGYHFGFPNAGKIRKDGNSHVFEPARVS